MTAPEPCQRWRDGRHSWQRTSVGGFDPSRYDVVALDQPSARAFVTRHHYAGRSWPSSKLRYGLVDKAPRADVAGAIPLDQHRGWLVGVANLGGSNHPSVLPRAFPALDDGQRIEVSRLVLLDEVPAPAESWFMARVADRAARRGVRGLLMHSDPVPRRTITGAVIMPGHVGIIYQALGSVYLGRATRRSLPVLPDGTVFSPRARSKITGREQGWRGATRQLIDWGARHGIDVPPLIDHGDASRWVKDTLRRLGADVITHPGVHRFALPIGPDRRMVRLGGDPHPYPKTPDLEPRPGRTSK